MNVEKTRFVSHKHAKLERATTPYRLIRLDWTWHACDLMSSNVQSIDKYRDLVLWVKVVKQWFDAAAAEI